MADGDAGVTSPDSHGTSNPTAWWYPDPAGRHDLRYWTGTAWSEFVIDGPGRVPSLDPPIATTKLEDSESHSSQVSLEPSPVPAGQEPAPRLQTQQTSETRSGRRLLVGVALALVAICAAAGGSYLFLREDSPGTRTGAPVQSSPQTNPTTQPTTPEVGEATKATVDNLLSSVVVSSRTWRAAAYQSALDKGPTAKGVLDQLEATYEAIGRLPEDVPSQVSSEASKKATHLWLRIWAEFECARVEDGFQPDPSGCQTRDRYPEVITLASEVIDALAPFSDASAADWVSQI